MPSCSPGPRFCRRPRRDRGADLAGRADAERPVRASARSSTRCAAPAGPRSARISTRWLDSARCDRALGLAEADHRRRCASASRRGSPRRRWRNGRGRGRRDRGGLARARAALPAACSPGSTGAAGRPRPRRAAELPPADAGQAAGRGRTRRARSGRTIAPNGNGTASGCSWSSRAAASGGSIPAPATRSARAFPEIVAAMTPTACSRRRAAGAARRRGRSPFNDLQQRLNRKTVTPKMLSEYPASVRLYDMLRRGGEDLRPLPLRRAPHAARGLVRASAARRGSTSRRWCRFADWDELQPPCATARAQTASRG